MKEKHDIVDEPELENIKHYLAKIENEITIAIVSSLNAHVESNKSCSQFAKSTICPIDLNDIPTHYSENMSLTHYLFLKVKEYTLEHLLVNLLCFNDYHNNLMNEQIDADCFFLLAINNKSIPTSDISANKILSEFGYTTKRTRLQPKIDSVNQKFEDHEKSQNRVLEEVNRGINFYSPASVVCSVIEKEVDDSFYFKNLSFVHKHFGNSASDSKVSSSFKGYIDLIVNVHEALRGNPFLNIFNLLETIKTDDHPPYNANRFDNYLKNRNDLIESSNRILKSILKADELPYYANYYLLKKLHNSEFFSSTHNPLVSSIANQISLQDLYFVISSNDIIEPDILFSNFTTYSQLYKLRLLELLELFDINLNKIDKDIYAFPAEIFGSFFSAKENCNIFTTKNFRPKEDQMYLFIQQQLTIYNSTLDFLHDFLTDAYDLVTSISINICEHMFNPEEIIKTKEIISHAKFHTIFNNEEVELGNQINIDLLKTLNTEMMFTDKQSIHYYCKGISEMIHTLHKHVYPLIPKIESTDFDVSFREKNLWTTLYLMKLPYVLS